MRKIIISALLILGMVLPAMAASTPGFCPICGAELDCNDKQTYDLMINTQAVHQPAPYETNMVYIPNCDYGKPFISLTIPTVCNKCQDKYGKDVERSIQKEIDYWWKGILKDNTDVRTRREIERRDNEIKRLEAEIRKLKESK